MSAVADGDETWSDPSGGKGGDQTFVILLLALVQRVAIAAALRNTREGVQNLRELIS